MYIAELSCNHNHDIDVCLEMVRSAHRVGADVVKLQLFTPSQMTHRRYSERYHITEGLWKGSYLWDLYERCRTPKEWLPVVKAECDAIGINLMVSIFHPSMVDYCLDHDVRLFKIASPEVGYDDLIEELSFTEYPVFASTGLALRNEVEYLVGKIDNLTLMHCVSEYPCRMESCNLLTLLDLVKFGKPVGLSDHTDSIVAPVVATTLGAVVIEKHFKVVDDCLDSKFSLNPQQFYAMVCACEDAKESLGKIHYSGGGRYKRKLVDGDFVRVVK